jgi:hypothetical protein
VETDVLQFIASHIGPVWASVAGAIAVAYIAMVGLGRLFDIWRSFRTRRAILEEEKLFNEILKIRYEIEILRKQNDLPDLAALGDHPSVARSAQQTSADRARTQPRFSFELPDVPSFSFAPLLSLFTVRLRRPGPGIPRSFWALKLLGAAVVLFVIGVVIIMEAPIGSSRDLVLGLFAMLSGVVAVYFIATAAFNLARALVKVIASG